MSQLIDTVEFYAPIVREYSSTPKPDDLGAHTSTMELHKINEFQYCIEWDIPDIDESVEFGIWCAPNAIGDKILVDYDGAFSLPAQAIELLRSNGVIVPKDFE